MTNSPISELLAVKTSPPFLRPNTIHRVRLLDQFTLQPHQRLLLVSAPAGYGKSTLLADWRQHLMAERIPAAWLTLDESLNDPGAFLSAICQALCSVLPAGEAAREDLTLLASSGGSHRETLTPYLMAALGQLSQPCVLILDDYHTITHVGVHHLTGQLIERCGDVLRLAVGSRADPPLALVRLRARGELVELRTADLRFTEEETADFAAGALQLCLTAGEVRGLERCTEGWAVGLQLIGLSLRKWPAWAQSLLGSAGQNRQVLGYLAEEVFQKLDHRIQSFLLYTCILDELSAPLCDSVWQDPRGEGAEAVLSWLEQENLFVVPLDPFGRRFRYHALFSDFLRTRLAVKEAGHIPVLHHQASRWFWSQGFVKQAVRHAQACGDPGWLVHLLEQAGVGLLNRSELTALRGWLDAVPADLLVDNPLLQIISAWDYLLLGRLEQVEICLARAEAHLTDSSDDLLVDIPGYPITPRILRGHALTLRAFLARIRTAYEDAVRLSNAALLLLPKDELVVRSTLVFNLAQVYKETYAITPCRTLLEEAVQVSRTSGNLYIQLISAVYLGMLDVLQGRMVEANAHYREALQLGYHADGSVAIPAVSFAEAWIGAWHYLQNQIDEALTHLRRSIKLAEVCGEYGMLHDATLLLAQAALAQGDGTTAQQMLEKAGRIPLEGIPASHEWIEGMTAWVRSGLGHIQEALVWAERVPAITAREKITRSSEKRMLAALRVKTLAVGAGLLPFERLPGCLAALEVLTQAAEEDGRLESLVELLVLRASMQHLRGDGAGTRKALEAAHRLADPLGWTRVFVDAPVQLHGEEHEISIGLTEALTGREVDLLHLIAEGATNQEIAARLFISIGTVKSHLNHLFAKLGARHRTEAVARARKLGLL